MSDSVSTSDGDRIRIWYLLAALSVGGAERRVIDIANGLDSDIYEPTVLTIFDHNPLADEFDSHVTLRSLGGRPRTGDDPSEAIQGAANPVSYLVLPLRLLRLIRRERPDVLHSFLFYENLLARFAGILAPGTIVVTEALGFRNSGRTEVRVTDRLTRRLSDRIVANSEAGGRYFSDRGVPANRVDVIPGGRDLSSFTAAEPADLEADLGIPDDAPLVGTVGRFVERKGHDELLEAWGDIVDRNSDAHLLLVGDGPRRDVLERRVAEKGWQDSVHFPGIRTDTPPLLARMDVFAFPSHWEGLPGALIEAMASGTPCVATRVEGNEELIDDGETGVLVPLGEPALLANSVTALLEDPEWAARLGSAARADVEARFTTDRLVSDVEALYAEVV